MDFHNTKKFKRLARFEKDRILRIFIFALFLFFVVTIMINIVLADYTKTKEYNELYELYPIKSVLSSIENLKSQRDNKLVVAFIGDSIFKYRGISISEFYQELNDNVSVYDLSYPGAPIHYKYLVAKSILNDSDIIILNINYFWFSEKYSETKHNDEEINTKNKTFEIKDNIPILNERENIQGMILGGHPRKRIEEIENSIRCKDNCYNEKIESFDSLSIERKKTLIDEWFGNNIIINSSNVNFIYLEYLEKISELAKSSNKIIIVVIAPGNPEVKNHRLWEKYKNDTLIIKSVLNDSIILLDYGEINISSSYYMDSHHFTDEGKRLFAEILYNDTKKYLGK